MRTVTFALIASSLFLLAMANSAFNLLCPAQASAPQADSKSADFESAVKLYNARNYAQAIPQFLKLSAKDPRNTTIALYLGNCYYASHQSQFAATYYQWIANNYPLSPEAITAVDMLTKMGMSPAQKSTASKGASQTAAKETADTDASHLDNVDVASMISVVKAQGTHPGCTPDFIKQVTSALDSFPKGLMHYMMVHGCKICITPSLIDRNPELRNTRPRGYNEGYTYKNTPAMFEKPTVVVCQYAQIGENEDDWRPMEDAVGSLRHEFGHAIDHFMGNLSKSETYKHIYFLDRARIDPDYKNELSYYIQEGTEGGGASECLAEAACIILGGRKPHSEKDKRDEHFSQAFPNVMKYVKEKVNAAK